MIERLKGKNNPNFFFLNYHKVDLKVSDFYIIPKHFFIPSIIEKRNPLSQTAERAGWVGCNIVLTHIPESGKIFFVKQGIIEPVKKVVANWKKGLFLREQKEFEARGWLLDTMMCIDKLKKSTFSLSEIYGFENELSKKYPDNRHIKDKLRQQLQILRDKGYLDFIGNGNYRLV